MKKKISLILAIVLAGSLLAGCGSSRTENEGTQEDTAKETENTDSKENTVSEGDSFLIGVASPNNKVPYFSKLVEGMTDLQEELNVELDVQDAQDDTNTQINQIQTFIAEGCDLIIMMPVQLESLIPIAMECNEAEIPIMTVDRKLSASDPKDRGVDLITHVGCDDVEGGRKQGELVHQLLGDEGSIALIQGTLGASSQVLRQQGLEEYLSENAPGIEIVAAQNSDQDQSQAITVTQNFLTRFAKGEIDAIVAQDPYSALGAVDAIKSASRDELLGTVIGYDLPSEVLDSIKAKDMYGSTLQAPYDMGALTLQVAYQCLTEGSEEIEANTYTEIPVVYIENAREYDPAW